MAATIGEAARALEEIEDAVTAGFTIDDLADIGDFALDIVHARTALGLDVDHVAFEPYSPAYAAARTSHGLQAWPVDLRSTGAMLAGFAPVVSTSAQEVRVQPTSEQVAVVAGALNAGVDRVAAGSGPVSYTKGASRSRGGSAAPARRVHEPKREFLDIRHPTEVGALAEHAAELAAHAAERGIAKASG